MKPDVEPEVDYDSSHDAEQPRDVLYIKVAAALFVLTGLEIYTSYADWLGDAFLPILLILMAIKFLLVVLFFMHLKFDSRIFGRLFWSRVLPRRRPCTSPRCRRSTSSRAEGEVAVVLAAVD